MKTIVKAVRDGRTCRVCSIADGHANDLDLLRRACENRDGGCRCVMLPFAPLVSPTATIVQRIGGWFAAAWRQGWRRALRNLMFWGAAVAAHFLILSVYKPGIGRWLIAWAMFFVCGEMLDRLYGRTL